MSTALLDFLIQPAITAAILAGLALVARETVSTFIKDRIDTRFKAQQELFAFEVRQEEARRQKAAQIADVICTWLALEYDPQKKADPAAYLELERKYWELALWLDASTLGRLNDALIGRPRADYKIALADVRNALAAPGEPHIEAKDFVHWEIPGRPESSATQAGPPA